MLKHPFIFAFLTGGVLLLFFTQVGQGIMFAEMQNMKLAAQIFISGVSLLASVYVLLIRKDKDETLKKWAIGVIGTILGFWLKG